MLISHVEAYSADGAEPPVGSHSHVICRFVSALWSMYILVCWNCH